MKESFFYIKFLKKEPLIANFGWRVGLYIKIGNWKKEIFYYHK